MRRFSFVGFAATGVLVALGASPVIAAGSIAYVSRTGSGSTCVLSAPCNNMPAAITAAGPGGEVICLDKYNYGNPGSIIVSVTISCGDGLWEAPAASITINTPAAGADVVIEGLVADDLQGPTSISFTGQGTLHLRRVKIGNSANTGSAPNHGFNFTPSGPAKLHVSDSVFYNLTSGTSANAGINIKPAAGVTASITITNSLFEYNAFGIIADGTGGGIIRGLIKDCIVSNNRGNGITVSTSGSAAVLTVDNTAISGNNYGLAVAGTNAGMLVTRSTITANATGLFSSGGAALLSYGDNRVNANTTTDGAFTGTVGLR